MKNIIVLSIVLLAGCNPCKHVLKHPECFPADSVIINKETIKYEKEYITNDSIVFQEIPCDPVDSIIYKTKTFYKTRNVLKIDTIYSNKETTKINPVNTELQKDNDKLTNKVDSLKKWLKVVSGGLLLSIVILILLLKYK